MSSFTNLLLSNRIDGMKKDSVLGKLFSGFKKQRLQSAESVLAAEESMKNIQNSFGILNEKTKNIEDKYPEQKKQINEYYEQVMAIIPSVSVRAGKFEQALAQEITKVSSLCDQIFVSDDVKVFDSELKMLGRFIRERQNADIEQDE